MAPSRFNRQRQRTDRDPINADIDDATRQQGRRRKHAGRTQTLRRVGFRRIRVIVMIVTMRSGRQRGQQKQSRQRRSRPAPPGRLPFLAAALRRTGILSRRRIGFVVQMQRMAAFAFVKFVMLQKGAQMPLLIGIQHPGPGAKRATMIQR